MEDVVASGTIETASAEYLGRWRRLVSTTNWEKGRIIAQWRAELASAGAPPAEFSDDAWSRRAGSVSPQHVGRLRRVWERFGEVRESYPGLYWSHFQAALDWNDAELWLEGAVQNGWSISQMRTQRAETLGQVSTATEELPAEEFDADAGEPETFARQLDAPRAEVFDPAAEAVFDAAHAEETETEEDRGRSGIVDLANADGAPPAAVRPFAHLAALPDDLEQACEGLKLAILRHKLAGWRSVRAEDVAAHLEALRQLALSPAEV